MLKLNDVIDIRLDCESSNNIFELSSDFRLCFDVGNSCNIINLFSLDSSPSTIANNSEQIQILSPLEDSAITFAYSKIAEWITSSRLSTVEHSGPFDQSLIQRLTLDPNLRALVHPNTTRPLVCLRARWSPFGLGADDRCALGLVDSAGRLHLFSKTYGASLPTQWNLFHTLNKCLESCEPFVGLALDRVAAILRSPKGPITTEQFVRALVDFSDSLRIRDLCWFRDTHKFYRKESSHAFSILATLSNNGFIVFWRISVPLSGMAEDVSVIACEACASQWRPTRIVLCEPPSSRASHMTFGLCIACESGRVFVLTYKLQLEPTSSRSVPVRITALTSVSSLSPLAADLLEPPAPTHIEPDGDTELPAMPIVQVPAPTGAEALVVWPHADRLPATWLTFVPEHSVLYCAKGFSVLVWLVRVPQPPAGSADASVCASLEWTRFVRLEGTPLVTGLVHLSSSPFEFASAEKEKDSEAGQEVSGERAERRGEEADAGGGRSLTLIACGSTHSLHRVCVQWTTDTADESIGGCSGSGCSVLHLELLDSAEPTSKPVARQSRFLNLRSSASGVLLYLLDECFDTQDSRLTNRPTSSKMRVFSLFSDGELEAFIFNSLPSASARIDSLVELVRRAYMRPGDDPTVNRSELLDAILMRLSNSELINDLQLTRCLYTKTISKCTKTALILRKRTAETERIEELSTKLIYANVERNLKLAIDILNSPDDNALSEEDAVQVYQLCQFIQQCDRSTSEKLHSSSSEGAAALTHIGAGVSVGVGVALPVPASLLTESVIAKALLCERRPEVRAMPNLSDFFVRCTVPACDALDAHPNVRTICCERGHRFSRCVQTLLPAADEVLRKCRFCTAVALLPMSSSPSKWRERFQAPCCPLCNFYVI